MKKKSLEERDIEIEAKLLEQEHRPTHLVLNYLKRKAKWPNESDPRRKAVSKAIIWRLFFSPAVLAFTGSSLLAWATLWFMNRQNSIIEVQTELLEEQNKKIEIQANLEEASRRNNLVFLMDNVLNKIGEELKEKDNVDSVLSKPLIARIQALGQGFQPYKFIDYNSDSLRLTRELSPERGQLLLSLANIGIGRTTLKKIYEKTTFSYAYLKEAQLDSMYLQGVDLDYAYLNGANLYNSDLRNASVKYAEMESVTLDFSELNHINLEGTNLKKAHFDFVDAENSFMKNTVLDSAYILDSDFSKSWMKNASLINTRLIESDFNYVRLNNANLTGVDIWGADFSNLELEGVILNNTKRLYGLIVNRKDWIEYINKLNLNGANEIKSEYKLFFFNGDYYRVFKKDWDEKINFYRSYDD